jgi:hypothetical protein
VTLHAAPPDITAAEAPSPALRPIKGRVPLGMEKKVALLALLPSPGSQFVTTTFSGVHLMPGKNCSKKVSFDLRWVALARLEEFRCVIFVLGS